MNCEQISKLCETLILEEDGDVLVIDQNSVAEGTKKLNLCLTGKILGLKSPSTENMRFLCHKLWTPITLYPVDIIPIDVPDTFIFDFRTERDLSMVLSRAPWCFDGFLIVLSRPSGLGHVSSTTFSSSPLWIQIRNAPIAFRTRESARILGSAVGIVDEIDEGTASYGGVLGASLRMKVMVDLNRPLRRCVSVSVEGRGDEGKITLLVQYEGLPVFCERCGRVGHGIVECADRGSSTSTGSCGYGEWLRAAPPVLDMKRNSLDSEGIFYRNEILGSKKL